MKLKKLTPQLIQGLEESGYDQEIREIQSLTMPKIKSSADLFIIAPEGVGKSTAIAMGVVQRLKKAEGDSPRAIIITETKEKAFEMEELITLLGKRAKLRSFTVFDQGIIQYQKDMIYEGLDVLVGTPKRINELMSITGIPLNKIQMLVVDDAETLFPSRNQHIVYRVADAIERSQFIMVANRDSEHFEKLTERMMKNPLTIRLED